MPETTATPTQLTSQYSTQVATDLERNLKEQAQIREEIEALTGRLGALQQDHDVLVSIQQALGTTAGTAATPAAPVTATAVPKPRKSKTVAKAGKQSREKKPAAPAREQTRAKKAPAASPKPSAQPTLTDLIHAHLTGESEPRSAAEVTAAVSKQHPKRTIKTTVVRTTLENLVAKNRAQRTKQGSSVYYTAPGADAAGEPKKSAEQQSAESDS